MFDPQQWMLKCERISVESVRGTCATYEIYVERFNGQIRIELQNVSPENRAVAIDIAREYGYLTAEELKSNRSQLEAYGACAHGIDPEACPAGCGDR